MSDSESSPSSEVSDLLAPPPFGVAEATSEQLLPIPTSMEELLDTPEPVEAEAVAQALPEEPLPPLASLPAAARPVPPAPPPPAVAAVQPSARRSMAPILLAAVLVLGLGGVVGWLMTSAPAPAREDTVSTAAVQPGPAPQAPAAVPSPASSGAKKTLPTSRAELEKMTFEDRHALLATTRDEVSVELHVGLDLLQADQAQDACRTFADALNTIEASEDPELYRWALDDASVPKGSAPACEGLQGRLDALNAPEPAAASATPSKRKRAGRKRPRGASSPSKPASPAATPKPPAKPASSPSVATKLDDDLRGFGD